MNLEKVMNDVTDELLKENLINKWEYLRAHHEGSELTFKGKYVLMTIQQTNNFAFKITVDNYSDMFLATLLVCGAQWFYKGWMDYKRSIK